MRVLEDSAALPNSPQGDGNEHIAVFLLYSLVRTLP